MEVGSRGGNGVVEWNNEEFCSYSLNFVQTLLLFGVYGHFAYVHMLLRPETGDVSPGTEITGGFKLPHRC